MMMTATTPQTVFVLTDTLKSAFDWVCSQAAVNVFT